MERITKISELRVQASHSNGRADMCADVLHMFSQHLTEYQRTWLYEQQQTHRNEAIKILDEAVAES